MSPCHGLYLKGKGCIYNSHVFRWIKENVPDWQHTVVCSPDEGGTRRAGILAEKLHLPMALIHKESINEEHIISGNVQDKKVGLLHLFYGSCSWLK